ncbi:MAG: tetratricopeptide repeat protein [Vicinamibacterales bacterium]
MSGLLYVLFFFSGLSGLVYQVIWVRAFGNVFGNTVHSASLVVAVFMLGLGTGSYLAGRWADRHYVAGDRSPLRVYGLVELVIAALGLFISLLLPHLGWLSVAVTSYAQAPNGWHLVSTASYAWRLLAAVALLLPVTLLMGGTLTLLIRHCVRERPETESWAIAVLYAVNTAGAAVGCFLTDFTFIPAWGLMRTQLIAVTLNVIAGLGALLLAWRAATAGAREIRASVVTETPASGAAALMVPTGIALALSGFAALGLEIVWFRHTAILLGAFRSVFSLLLTVILVGIGAGSLFAAFLQRRPSWQESPSRPARWFILVQAALVATTLFGVASADVGRIDDALSTLSSGTSPPVLAELWFNLLPILVEVGLPAVLMGFGFPLANAMTQRAARAVGRRAGALYLANTVGGVAGALAAGFVLLPALGIQGSVTVLAAAAGLGIVPLFVAARGASADEPGRSRASTGVLAPWAALAVGGFVSVGSMVWWTTLPADLVTSRALPPLEPGESRLALTEGLTEVIAVTDVAGRGRRLLTNGHPMSATWPLSQRYMRALAHLPLLAIERPETVLVIGFGVGNTTHAATLHPSVARVEVADLSAGVLSHASYFDAVNKGVLGDPRVSVFLNDGRHHLLMQAGTTYDLITLEPPPIAYAGVSALYSREFYELARARLAPGGYISQWLPVYQVPGASSLAMVRAFVDVFPQAVLVSGAGMDLLLIGTSADRIELDPAAFDRRLTDRTAVQGDLARIDLGTVRELAGSFVGSARTLDAGTRGVAPVTDDRPSQEYGVRSLATPDTAGLTAIADLSRLSEWCPRCFVDGAPAPVVTGLDLYLALLGTAYSAPPEQFLRVRNLPPGERRIAGSAYLGAVVPESAAVHNLLGVALAARGAMDDAISEFRQALMLDPGAAETQWHLGAALAARGEFGEALPHLERAATAMPDSVDVLNDLGVALAAEGRTADAIERFRHALRLQPENEQARRNLAIASARQP